MFGFLIAVVAGFLTPQAESALARPLARNIARHIEVKDGEVTALAFGLALLGAAILCAVFNTGGLVGLVVGGLLGLFLTRIIAAGQARYGKGG